MTILEAQAWADAHTVGVFCRKHTITDPTTGEIITYDAISWKWISPKGELYADGVMYHPHSVATHGEAFVLCLKSAQETLALIKAGAT